MRARDGWMRAPRSRAPVRATTSGAARRSLSRAVAATRRFRTAGREPSLLHRGMATSRFDAQKMDRLATVNDDRRLEMELRDAAGKKILVSLPLPLAVELGCMICDMSEHAPYLVGGVQTRREHRTGR